MNGGVGPVFGGLTQNLQLSTNPTYNFGPTLYDQPGVAVATGSIFPSFNPTTTEIEGIRTADIIPSSLEGSGYTTDPILKTKKIFYINPVNLGSGVTAVESMLMDGTDKRRHVEIPAMALTTLRVQPTSMAIDNQNGWIYWAESFTGLVRRCTFTGSSPPFIQTVLSQSVTTTGMVIDPGPILSCSLFLTRSGDQLIPTDGSTTMGLEGSFDAVSYTAKFAELTFTESSADRC